MTISLRRLAAVIIATAFATWFLTGVVEERNNIDICEALPGDGCPAGKKCRGTYAVLYQPKPGLLGLWGTLHRKEFRCPATVLPDATPPPPVAPAPPAQPTDGGQP